MNETMQLNFRVFPEDYKYFKQIRRQLGLQNPGAFKILVESHKKANPDISVVEENQ